MERAFRPAAPRIGVVEKWIIETPKPLTTASGIASVAVLPPNLLRALEAKPITPVRSDVPCEVDARLVVTTHRDLEQDIPL